MNLFLGDREEARDDRTRQEILACLPDKISKEDNMRLIMLASMEEIRQATFQMGSRASGPDSFSGTFF